MPWCSVRLVSVLFTASVVLVIYAISVRMVYVTTVNHLQMLTQRFALSIAEASAKDIADVLDLPSVHAAAVSRVFQRPDVVLPLPRDDPTRYTTLTRLTNALMPVFMRSGRHMLRLHVMLDDGSAVFFDKTDPEAKAFGVYAINSALAVNGFGPYVASGYDGPDTMKPIPYLPVPDVALNQSGVGVAYSSMKQYFFDPKLGDHGVWVNPIEINLRTPALPGCFTMRSAAADLGLACIYYTTNIFTDVFARAQLSANTQLFAVDYYVSVFATTMPTPFTTYRNMTAAEAAALSPLSVPNNCWSTQSLRLEAGMGRYPQYSCRAFAKDYPYAPLQATLQQTKLFTKSSPTYAFGSQHGATATTVRVGDELYHVALGRVVSTFGLPNVATPYVVLVFVPEIDMVGEVDSAHRAAFQGAMVALIVALGVTLTVVHSTLLRPLRLVGQQLTSIANLDDELGTLPRCHLIGQVQAIEHACAQLREAVDSFERYVPRTVVKELIGAGNLCHIAMEHRACTMMFTQISRFSEMCEAVSMELLAPLLQQYFAKVSEIVAEHDGVVDKFIGDTIMIVWGAPKETADREKKAVLSGLLIVRAAKQGPLHDNFHSVGARLRVRVAVSTGTVLAGNMGTEQRLHYSVVGEAVAVLSRLAEFGRVVEADLLVDAAISQVCRLELCMHRVLPSPFVHPPYLVSGIRRDAPKSSAIVQLAAGGNDALFADAPTVEVARRLEAACKSFVTSRFDECLAELDAMAAAPEQTLNLSVVLRLKRAALAQKPV